MSAPRRMVATTTFGRPTIVMASPSETPACGECGMRAPRWLCEDRAACAYRARQRARWSVA